MVSYLNRDITIIDNATLDKSPTPGPSALLIQALRNEQIAEAAREGKRAWSYWDKDKRFMGFTDFCLRYADSSIDKIKRKALENKLYPMIILLLVEKRVKGNFKLQPYRDWETNQLVKRIGELERRWKTVQRKGIAP